MFAKYFFLFLTTTESMLNKLPINCFDPKMLSHCCLCLAVTPTLLVCFIDLVKTCEFLVFIPAFAI